jgi:heme a synthase
MLHRFAKFVAGCTVLLLLAGSLVTSTDSGLSVPDWPTTYGWNMFLFPPSKWVGGIFYEHGHRLIASGVGFLTIILAGWLYLQDERRWMRRLGVAALATVVAQGLLGGLTVLYFLPAPISTAHAALAEVFFCLTVAIALFTSPGWLAGYADNEQQPGGGSGAGDAVLRQLAVATTVLIFLQILAGATMRHLDAGLAIPDFPLMFGGLIPDHWDAKIAVHFAHRTGAVVVALAVIAAVSHVWYHHRQRPELMRPGVLLLALLGVQLTLGALTVLSRLHVWINSVHLVCGALVLTTSLVLTLRAWRVKFSTHADATVRRGAAAVVGKVRLKPDTTSGVEPVRLKPDATSGVEPVRLKPDTTSAVTSAAGYESKVERA